MAKSVDPKAQSTLDGILVGQYVAHLPIEERAALYQLGAQEIAADPTHLEKLRVRSGGGMGAGVGAMTGAIAGARPVARQLMQFTPKQLEGLTGRELQLAQARWAHTATLAGRVVGAGAGALAGFGLGALLGLIQARSEAAMYRTEAARPREEIEAELKRRDIEGLRRAGASAATHRQPLSTLRMGLQALPFLVM